MQDLLTTNDAINAFKSIKVDYVDIQYCTNGNTIIYRYIGSMILHTCVQKPDSAFGKKILGLSS